jgi:hypothetical protein
VYLFILLFYQTYDASLTSAEENESVLALHSLAKRYGIDRLHSSNGTDKKKNHDAIDLIALSPSRAPSSPSRPILAAPPHLMSIQSIGKQIDELEASAAKRTDTVEFVSKVVLSILQVNIAMSRSCHSYSF